MGFLHLYKILYLYRMFSECFEYSGPGFSVREAGQGHQPGVGRGWLVKWDDLCHQKVSQSVSSVTQWCPTLCDSMDCSMPGFPVHYQLLELTQTHVHWLGDAIQPSLSLSSPSPSIFNFPSIRVFSNESVLRIRWPKYWSFSYSISPSNFNFPSIRVFSNESVLRIRWPKYWSFSFSISPSNEHPGLISFRMDWLDLLAVQGTLKGLLQHHSSKASILRCSAFFIVQLSYPYMTTGKTIALTRGTFVEKVMSLLFNMLSRSSERYGIKS